MLKKIIAVVAISIVAIVGLFTLVDVPHLVLGSTPRIDKSAFEFRYNRGCNTNYSKVLASRGKDVVVDENGCIKSGSWVSAITGKVYTNPDDLAVTSVFPPEYIWKTFSQTMTRDEIIEAYNGINQWLIMEASLEEERGDRSYKEWLPPDMACAYLGAMQLSLQYYKFTDEYRDELTKFRRTKCPQHVR